MNVLLRPLPLFLLGVSLASPCWADDIMLNGLHCNSTCQSWMGVKGAATKQAPPVTRRTEPAAPVAMAPIVSPQLAGRRPQRPATLARAPLDATPAKAPPDAMLAKAPLEIAPANVAADPVAPVVQPSPERLVRQAPAVPAATPSAPAAPAVATSAPVTRPPVETDTAAPPRPADGPASAQEEAREIIEPRLPTAEEGAGLPALNTLVAVRGVVMLETAEERASNAKQRAALVKETSRFDQNR